MADLFAMLFYMSTGTGLVIWMMGRRIAREEPVTLGYLWSSAWVILVWPACVIIGFADGAWTINMEDVSDPPKEE